MLKSLVIVPNERIRDMRSLVNIAAAEAKRKEGVHQDIPIKTVVYVPECGVWVALYEWEHTGPSAKGREGSEK